MNIDICKCDYCESGDNEELVKDNEKFIEKELSDCCGATIDDYGLCSGCKEHA